MTAAIHYELTIKAVLLHPAGLMHLSPAELPVMTVSGDYTTVANALDGMQSEVFEQLDRFNAAMQPTKVGPEKTP